MFSPKVLDRANVIEFKPEENAVLDLFINPADNKNINPASNGTAEAFEKMAVLIRAGKSTPHIMFPVLQVVRLFLCYSHEFWEESSE